MPGSSGTDVVGIGDEGDGIVMPAGSEGGAARLYVPGAVPGDLVRMREDGSFDVEARPGAGRREALLCPHFPSCGGCSVQHLSDTLYRTWKPTRLATALDVHGLRPAIVHPMRDVPPASRRRAVLTAKTDATGVQLGFHEHHSHDLVDMRACAVLTPPIVAALEPLREVLRVVMRDGDEARVTVLDVGNGLDVSIGLGRRVAKGRHPPALARLAEAARVLRLTIDGEPVVQRARPVLDVGGVAVVPPPGAFVQAVREAEMQMADIALAAIMAAKAKRVADLFCGLGTFSFVLAKKARVLAVDSDRPLVEAMAEAARHAAGLKPIETRVRDLFSDPLSPLELAAIDAVVFDPPRAGAKAQAEALAKSKVRTVVAVSCNPPTLARDLAVLVAGGYRLEAVTPVDQFQYTSHLEAVAVLSRR